METIKKKLEKLIQKYFKKKNYFIGYRDQSIENKIHTWQIISMKNIYTYIKYLLNIFLTCNLTYIFFIYII